MVHAEASNFAEGISKEEAYEQLLLQAKGLFTDQRNWVCNLANTAALLWYAHKSMRSSSSRAINWAGFYVLDRCASEPQLILGPFQGKVACQTIKFGRGLCGKAAQTGDTQIAEDVDQFPGHIACDGNSKSEIVVPILADRDGSGTRAVVAVLNLDSAVLRSFDQYDKKKLEQLAELLSGSCDW